MRGKEPPFADPVRHLAEAYAQLVTGCTKTTLARDLRSGQLELPWVIGFRDPLVVVAEPWSLLHTLHRKKRGFTAMRERLTALIHMVEVVNDPCELQLEIWSDNGDFDEKLCLELERVLGRPIALFPPNRITEALSAVRAALPAAQADHPNPLIAVLSWVTAVDGRAPRD